MDNIPLTAQLQLIQLDMATLGAAAKIGVMNGRSDITHNCETFYREIAGLAFNIEVDNANKKAINKPGYDLRDDENHILIQITANKNIKEKISNTKRQIEKLKQSGDCDGYTTYIIFISEFSNLQGKYDETKLKIFSQADIFRKIEVDAKPCDERISEVELYLNGCINTIRTQITNSWRMAEENKPMSLTKDSEVFKKIFKLNSQNPNHPLDDTQLEVTLDNINNFQNYWWGQTEQTRQVISCLYDHGNDSPSAWQLDVRPPYFTYKTLDKVTELIYHDTAQQHQRKIGQIVMQSGITSFYPEGEAGDGDTPFGFHESADDEANGLFDLQQFFTQKSISKFLETCDFEDLLM